MITEERHGVVIRAINAQSWSRPLKKIVKDIKGLSEPEIISRVEDLIMAGMIDGDGGRALTKTTYIQLNEAGRKQAALMPAPKK